MEEYLEVFILHCDIFSIDVISGGSGTCLTRVS